MNQEASCECSKEARFGSDLGLNREIILNNSAESRDHRQNGGEKKIKTKLLAEVVILATLVVVMLAVSLVEAGTYAPYASKSGSGGGYVIASNYIVYDDQTYVINVGASSVYITAGISSGSHSVQESNLVLNTVNSWAYIRSDFFPNVGADYGMYAEAWTYPSYTADPSGASSGKWYL